MEDRQGERPKKFCNSISSLVKNLSRNSSNESSLLNTCKCKEETAENHDLSTRSRAQGIFRSIKKKFRHNKHICKTKQKMTAVDHQSVEALVFAQSANTKALEIEPPVPPPRTIVNKVVGDENPQYLDLSELNQDSQCMLRKREDLNKSLGKEHFNLAKYGWFWGPISKQEAEQKLCNEPDGSFLIRDSSSERYIFTLSFRSYGKTMHSHIEHSCGVFSMGKRLVRRSVPELIEAAIDVSKDSVFSYSQSRNPTEPAYPVRLTRPVSRLTEVRSLQYLCRFVIRQYINVNNIQKLPLPTTLKGYLQQGQY